MAEANRRHWNLYCPSSISDSRYPYRSVIWANNHLQTTQIVLPSSDITAIQITTPSDFVLVFSVYVPPTSFSQHPDQELLHRIEVITTAIRTQRARHPHRDFDIVIAGDQCCQQYILPIIRAYCIAKIFIGKPVFIANIANMPMISYITSLGMAATVPVGLM